MNKGTGAMKDRLLRILAITAVFAASAAVTTWSTGVTGQQPEGQKQKTLRERGAENNVRVTVPNQEYDSEYSDLQSLAKAAYLIVVGRIVEEQSAFDGDNHIVTTYKLDVQRVMKDAHLISRPVPGSKDPAPVTTPLKVVRSGGVVQYNGHHVNQYLHGSELLKAKKDYVLFLYWSPAFDSYKLLGGSSGAVLIRENKKGIRPLGFASGLLKYEGMNLDEFLNEVVSQQQ